MDSQNSPNDFKVVDFTNRTDFAFTPEMGCMYDGRPIFGITGAPSINPGESLKVPYHIGHRLATNLAKQVMVRRAPIVDPAGVPTGVPLWNDEGLEQLKSSFITDLYSEEKPAAVSETDKLMAKVEEYKQMVETLIANGGSQVPAPADAPAAEAPASFQDKADVIAELTRRGVKFDARKSKAELEALIV